MRPSDRDAIIFWFVSSPTSPPPRKKMSKTLKIKQKYFPLFSYIGCVLPTNVVVNLHFGPNFWRARKNDCFNFSPKKFSIVLCSHKSCATNVGSNIPQSTYNAQDVKIQAKMVKGSFTRRRKRNVFALG